MHHRDRRIWLGSGAILKGPENSLREVPTTGNTSRLCVCSYISTSKTLKSKVRSVRKGGGKKPMLGKVSTYRTSPNRHLSMI